MDAGLRQHGVLGGDVASTNNADRLRKYLARFDIDWNALA
jgi:sigma54-dependent transcription regulator